MLRRRSQARPGDGASARPTRRSFGATLRGRGIGRRGIGRGNVNRLNLSLPSIGRPALLGWTVAGIALVVLAFVVGRPAQEQGVLAGSPSATTPPPLAITFGTALDPQTNVASADTSRFRPGDPFAYSVTMAGAPGTDTIWVEIIKHGLDGDSVAQEASVQHILPDAATFAFQVRTDDLLAAWGAGDFEMRIYLDPVGRPVATGSFTLVDA